MCVCVRIHCIMQTLGEACVAKHNKRIRPCPWARQWQSCGRCSAIRGKTSFKYNSQKPLRKRISRAKYIFVYNIHRVILLLVNNPSFFFLQFFWSLNASRFKYLFYFSIRITWCFNFVFLSRILLLRILMLMRLRCVWVE